MQVHGTTPSWAAARVLLGERGDDFFRRREKVLETFDAEDIHDLRVSSRRMREGLALFAPFYPPGNLARLIKRIRGVTRLLGAIRNNDEAALFFSSLREELDGSCHGDLDRLVTSYRDARGKELGRLDRGLREISGKAFHDRYRRVVNAPSLFAPPAGGADPFTPLAAFASDSLAVRVADVLKLVPDARVEGHAEAQHRMRIALKHFRYRMEILSFLLGGDYPELHAGLKRYQDLLGKMHDLDVFAGIIREAGFAPRTAGLVLEAVTARRSGLFADFSAMLATLPIERVGVRVRDAL